MSTRKTPYEFQKKAVYAAIKFILNRHKEELYDRHGIIVSPTGSGKSLMIADLADEIIKRFPRTSDGTQTKILILTHNQTLVEQNHEEAETHLGFPCGVYAAKLKRKDRHHQVTFAMIQSLHPNHKTFRDIGRVDIVLVDEAHMIPFKDTAIYREYIDFLLEKNPKMSVTGFTATPYRLDGGLLIEGDNRLFTDQLFDIPVKLLLEQGFLSPLITPSQLDTSMSLDTSGLKLNKDNDFQAKSLATLADNHVEDYLYKALDEAVEHLGDRKKWMIFCPSSESAILATKYLNDKGFSGGCALSPSSAKKAFEKLDDKGYDVSSTLELNTDKVNARNIGNFKYGDARFIVNMDMLTTGFNVNEIDAIILLRPTASLSLYIQILGRGTRTCEGKLNCLVLDFAKNIETHGYFDDPNLPTSKAGAGGGEQPVKYCRKTDEKGKFIKGCDEHREKPLKIQTVYCPDCHMLLIEEKPKNEIVASKASLLSFEEEPIINTYKMLRNRH